MSDNDNGSKITLSRRKALAGLGTIGAAGALGLGSTYAQFTDTENATATFSAGAIDGSLSYGATYNTAEDAESPNTIALEENQQDGNPVVSLELDDVKPGDYGSITFGIEVTNNPAWVASCLGISEDSDNEQFEPEIQHENTHFQNDLDEQDDKNRDSYGSKGKGELAENFWLIPFYTKENPDSGDDPLESTFFDAGWPNYDYGPDEDLDRSGTNLQASNMNSAAIGTNEAFWNSREGGNDWDCIKPMLIRQAIGQELQPGTVGWGNGGGFDPQPAPEAVANGIGEGCVFIDGSIYDDGDDNQEDGVEPAAVQPGDTIYFGYDWHVPFGAGNDLMGDKLTVDFGFNFSQIRHTESAALSNIFAPGENTPNESST